MISKIDKPTVGIIGRGNFSRLLKELIGTQASKVSLIGRDSTPEERRQVLGSDIVIIGVTLDAYPVILSELSNSLKPESLLIDICSVKVKPLKLIKEYLPRHNNLLITHPLFGPQSAIAGTKGLKLIVCKQSGELAHQVLSFCSKELELDIIEMTAEEHDDAMAYTHALTFFISQALQPFNLGKHGITTPSFQKLLSLSNIAKNETPELLMSIHQDNPFAQEVRDKFADQVDKLREKLDN